MMAASVFDFFRSPAADRAATTDTGTNSLMTPQVAQVEPRKAAALNSPDSDTGALIPRTLTYTRAPAPAATGPVGLPRNTTGHAHAGHGCGKRMGRAARSHHPHDGSLIGARVAMGADIAIPPPKEDSPHIVAQTPIEVMSPDRPMDSSPQSPPKRSPSTTRRARAPQEILKAATTRGHGSKTRVMTRTR